MKNLKGLKVVLTGASGGIGVFLARALAREGMDLLLVAYPGSGLPELSDAASGLGVQSRVICADLREPAERERIIERAVAEFGRVDILINNAGVEYSSFYHELSIERIREVLAVNLEAPMMLTHLVLPGMLARRRGHIVNMSSLAGKSGPAYQESYAATKAALTAFTFSLRASYEGTGVSASVICPGFVEAGIYARLKARTGCAAPALLTGCPPEAVARAMLRAIRRDRAEIIVNRFPIRPVLGLAAACPALGAWITKRIGVHDFFRRVIAAQARGKP